MFWLLPLFVSVFVFVSVIEFSSEFGQLTSWAFRKCMVWGVPEVWRQCYSSSMNSGKIVAGGRVDGTDRGSIRGPRGPKNILLRVGTMNVKSKTWERWLERKPRYSMYFPPAQALSILKRSPICCRLSWNNLILKVWWAWHNGWLENWNTCLGCT